MTKKFYVTTAIDYTDDVIHVGHIYQKIIADVLARFHRLLGEKVFFLTGTDEHGGKVEKAIKDAGFKDKNKAFVDKIAQQDKVQQKSVNISFDRFIRTTDKDHLEFVAKFWQKVEKNGDIYLSDYWGIYCDGCEAFLSKTDLIDGKCPFHPTKEPKIIKEKNYFFHWSKYADFLKDHIQNHRDFIWPESRKNEMLSFIKQGIQDIPISRPKIEWGIPVPGHPEHTIYVWFDALINYLTGCPEGFWPADVHVLGKDNTRWHALLWPAMLKSAGYELPKTVLVNGFLTLNGQKISKSIGNIIRPTELAEKFGADAVRFYLLKCKTIESDGDISLEKIKEIYNADLANSLGNLVARAAKLCEKPKNSYTSANELTFSKEAKEKIKSFRFNEALESIWDAISEENKRFNQEKPWELKDRALENFLSPSVQRIHQIAFDLQPFMPETAKIILEQFRGPKIRSGKPLFPRI